MSDFIRDEKGQTTGIDRTHHPKGVSDDPIKRFLDAGTEMGLGDLSMMVGVFSQELERAEEIVRFKLIGERSDSLGLFTVAHGKGESPDYIRGANDQIIADQVKVDEIVERAQRKVREEYEPAEIAEIISMGGKPYAIIQIPDAPTPEFFIKRPAPEKHTNPSEV